MHILAINGAPRPDGHTSDLLSVFCKGAEEAGSKPDCIRLAEFDIRPCLGCFCCWRSRDREPRCAIADDMAGLIARLAESDVFIFATPLYFHSFSSLLKIFIERLLPLLEPELVEGPPGHWKNRLRSRRELPQRAVLIAAAGYRDAGSATGLVTTFRLIADSLGAEPAGILVRPESFFMDFALSSPGMRRELSAVTEAVRVAGSELVTLGAIRPETIAAAGRPLVGDQSLFNRHFSAYWQIAREAGGTRPVRKAVRKAARADLRFLMPDLAERFDPVAGAGFRAVIAFDFHGRQPGHWHLDISEGRCRLLEGSHEAPDVTVESSSEVFVGMLTDRRDPKRMLESGKLRATGEIERFLRLFELLQKPES